MITRRFIAVAALVVLVPVRSTAAEVGASGWWTTSPLAVAPDAQDALVVQGGPQADQPLAYAAVEFALAEGESASWLRLTVAESSVSTASATLTVCPLTDSFAPADGGPMADAPPYDCTAKASAPAVGGTYAFDVTSLTGTGTLALAVLPGAVNDRVVLDKPTADALETSVAGGAGGSDTTAGGDTGTGAGATADGGTSPGADGGFEVPSFPTGSLDLPAIDVPTPVVEGTDAAAVPPSATQAPSVALDPSSPTTSGDDSGVPIAPTAFVCLALLAAGLWTTASRMADGTSAA